MRSEVQQSDAISEKRGIKVYLTNPSVPEKGAITRPRRRQIGDEHKGLVIDDGSGEVLGRGAAIAYEWEEVDSERFVKFIPRWPEAGVRAVKGRACSV